jgi:hypothetical protein
MACEPPRVERPREGAAPIVGGTPVRVENPVPPTLVAASSLSQTATPTVILRPPPSPSPGITIAGSPAPLVSPGIPPIISSLQPAPGASLPAGDVVIGARVSGSSDLVDVLAFVDGEDVPVDLGETPVRVKMVSFVRTLDGGTHEIRIQARDERGQLGGYRWQFTVGVPRQPVRAPAPAPTVRPAPTSPIRARTPVPAPTRRPTVVLPTLQAAPP